MEAYMLSRGHCVLLSWVGSYLVQAEDVSLYKKSYWELLRHSCYRRRPGSCSVWSKSFFYSKLLCLWQSDSPASDIRQYQTKSLTTVWVSPVSVVTGEVRSSSLSGNRDGASTHWHQDNLCQSHSVTTHNQHKYHSWLQVPEREGGWHYCDIGYLCVVCGLMGSVVCGLVWPVSCEE